jgi:serine/threonine protein kinase
VNPAHRERVKELLAEAARLPLQERAAYIERAAGADRVAAAEALDLLATLDDSAFLIAPTGGGLSESGRSLFPGEGPGSRIDRYKLLQLVGEGGFGMVYMAEQVEPVHRRVALKIIKAGMDTRQVIARFEAERQALAMMDHPNIARVLDAGATPSGRPYFVMELVRGEPVTRYCDRERLSVRQRLELFRDVCHAVQHAHQKGIIHRDIKPSNVLVTMTDGEPLPKIIDFGIAKATAGRLTEKTLFTEMHQLIGTPEYMSPEQAEITGVDIDTRSDIYSLGVLLYELLVGSTPLEGGRLRATPLAEIQRLIREEEPPRPSLRFATLVESRRVRPIPAQPDGSESRSSAVEIARQRMLEPPILARTLRGDLDWIVMKCLEKDRRRRYPTAGTLAEDIGRYLSNQPVSAIPPSTGYRLRKFVRRNRTAVAAGSVMAAVLLLGVVGTVAGLVWAVRERRIANEQRILAQAGAIAARSEAERADREAEQARSVNQFLREVLASAQPGNIGADARVIDQLAGASATASERFADRPLQEAQLRELLAQIYSDLSMWSEANAECSRAVALWTEHAGEDDPRTLRTESRCLGIGFNAGLLAEREEKIAALLPRLERVLGPDDSDTLSARVSAANAHLRRGRPDEAERILLEVRVHPNLADDDVVQIRILRSLTMVTRFRAMSLDREEGNRLTATVEPWIHEWRMRATRRFGENAPVTLETNVWLADVFNMKGDYAGAAAMGREFLARTEKRLGECHELRAQAMQELAVSLSVLGEKEEPADLALRSLACNRAKYAADNPVLLGAISDTLPYLECAGRAVDGEMLARELLTALEKTSGHGDLTFGPEAFLARFLSMQDRLDEAETVFQSLFPRTANVGHFGRARFHLFYGGQLARRELFEEAEVQLVTAVGLVDDFQKGTWIARPDDLVMEFIDLYERWGKPGKAEEYRRLLDEPADPHPTGSEYPPASTLDSPAARP